MQRVVASIAAAVFTAVVLVGCTTADGSASSGSEGGRAASTAPATPTPTVMSDEEALQTGVETFDKLLAAEFELVRTKGESIDQLDALITENMAEYRERLLKNARVGYVPKGNLKVEQTKLQRVTDSSITFYGCLDYSKGWVETTEGEVVGGPREGKVGAFEITVSRSSTGAWQVDRKNSWDEPGYCSA